MFFYEQKKTINLVENLQLKLFRCLLAVPDSTPKPIMRFDLGCLKVLEKINIRKLTFLHFLLSSSEENLSRQIINIQLKYDFFPGLVTESRELLTYYDLPDIIEDKSLSYSKQQWKKIVSEAVREKSEEEVKKEFSSYSKLNSQSFQDEKFELKDNET